jgi:hypothetical protein
VVFSIDLRTNVRCHMMVLSVTSLYLYCSPTNMKASDIIPLGNNAYELEKGDSGRKPGKDDAFKLKFGGVETAFNSRMASENADVL